MATYNFTKRYTGALAHWQYIQANYPNGTYNVCAYQVKKAKALLVRARILHQQGLITAQQLTNCRLYYGYLLSTKRQFAGPRTWVSKWQVSRGAK